MANAWEQVLEIPVPGRSCKPRDSGFTMVIDKCLGCRQTEDLVEMAAQWIDDVKLTFGTSAFYTEDVLRRKIEIIRSAGVDVMPGGTYFEVAVWQSRVGEYLDHARKLGFTMIEVSDGTIDIPTSQRRELIRQVVGSGLRVLSEVGKKDPNEKIATELMHEEIASDLSLGVYKVIVEAREAGKGVGIYDKDGKLKLDEMDAIVSGVSDPNDLVWEAPIKNQQQELILRFGCNVNLGNIPPDEVLALEALRQGLRGDTLKNAYLANPSYAPAGTAGRWSNGE